MTTKNLISKKGHAKERRRDWPATQAYTERTVAPRGQMPIPYTSILLGCAHKHLRKVQMLLSPVYSRKGGAQLDWHRHRSPLCIDVPKTALPILCSPKLTAPQHVPQKERHSPVAMLSRELQRKSSLQFRVWAMHLNHHQQLTCDEMDSEASHPAESGTSWPLR